MSEKIQAIRGMNDILPDQSFIWQNIETTFKKILLQYSYKEIRLPLLENTRLFKRSIGEVTDIVEKEMYTFADLNGDSLSLRPEGTASVVRACLEHSLLYNQQQKLWYLGAMFRHERPQKGRYRQFYQLGVEVLGIEGVAIELELILLANRIFQELEITHALELEINSIGSFTERKLYREKLIEYLTPITDKLDKDSQKRLHKNPLRILDSKNEEVQELIKTAPTLLNCISRESRQRFDSLCEGLDELNVAYKINPFLVRGLDYYGHSVFEWKTNKLGSQATVCAGGRYDDLVEHLGGSKTPATGFALGMERLILLQEILEIQYQQTTPLIFFIATGDKAINQSLIFAEKLRDLFPDKTIIVNTQGGSFKSQFKKADKTNARFALIIGENELAANTIGLKELQKNSEQIYLSSDKLIEYFKDLKI